MSLDQLISENAQLRLDLATAIKESSALRDLLTLATNRLLAVVGPLERTARATEEIAARDYTVLLEIRTRLESIGTNSAVALDNIKDVQRDITGTFRKFDEPDHVIPRSIDAVGRLKPETLRSLVLLALLMALLGVMGWALYHVVMK